MLTAPLNLLAAGLHPLCALPAQDVFCSSCAVLRATSIFTFPSSLMQRLANILTPSSLSLVNSNRLATIAFPLSYNLILLKGSTKTFFFILA